MKIYLAGDHAGFDTKQRLLQALATDGHDVEDLGPTSFDKDDDYPDFVAPLAERLAAEPEARGILLGGSGQGEAMVANRTKGVRAAVFYGPQRALEPDAAGHAPTNAYDVVKLPRLHNDANALSIGTRFTSPEEALEAARVFLSTEFSGEERHVRRLKKF